MHFEGKAPNFLMRRIVGWQAARIVDPVERLKFLRRTVGDQRLLATAAGSGAFRPRRRTLAIVAGAAALLAPASYLAERTDIIRPAAVARQTDGPARLPSIWVVENTPQHENYSNGLRIERRFETANEPRSYLSFAAGEEDSRPPETGVAPVGIVYHTTESQQEEFEASKTPRLTYLGEALLRYVQREKAYHYLIDRFGRVWRVVREQDAAWHAGPSVWSSGQRTWVSLNRSFFGVSLEAATTEQARGRAVATPAQVNSLRLLTEMLRSRYSIPAANCVTHAQVSVNPSNMQVGYHTDWAAHFPYAEIGLPDNYALRLPALYRFGFAYDPSLVNVTGERYWKGLLLGEEQLRQDATAHGLPGTAWRKQLAARYKVVAASMKEQSAEAKEKNP